MDECVFQDKPRKNECAALSVKNCKNCSFFKPAKLYELKYDSVLGYHIPVVKGCSLNDIKNVE